LRGLEHDNLAPPRPPSSLPQCAVVAKPRKAAHRTGTRAYAPAHGGTDCGVGSAGDLRSRLCRRRRRRPGSRDAHGTPTATPTETPRPDPPPRRARSTKDCLASWNRDEQRGSGSQVSHTDFLADLAQRGRTPVRVEYSRPSCFVVAKIGPRRVAVFVTVRNHAFYDQPRRENIPQGRVVNFNARALQDGRIAMR
jgi:hypothetical protein